ncbi:MAG: VWA domain-containing protein, partial [Akkermansiaceae bacterium]|nr:VWA domain-containing protein [Akkermansiaceae bacterium]
MSFLHPYVLLGLAVPLLLAGALLILHRRTGSAWRLLVSAEHPELVHRRPQWQLVLPPVLALLALAGLICAAARPINGYTQSEASSSGRNLLIALDISRSMETKDVKPSRLEEARAAAYELIEALPGDKIGLIVFSGEADVVVPLTYDHTALRDALEQVNRDWAGYGGTNFGLLLRTAMQSFARSAPEGANALIILSDGEDTVGSSSSIAEEARKKHLLVITVGIGTTTGDTIPDPDGENGLWQNASGSHVVSKLDVQSLRQFSEATGGDFILMNSGTDLAAFARDAADKLERHEESYAAGSTPQDLFVWFAVPSLLALLAAILLSTEWRRPRRKAAALLLLLLVLTPAAQAAEASAAQAYARALEARQAGRDSEHLEQLSQALLSQDSELQAAAHLALGNRAARATFDKLRSLYGESSPAADSVAPAEAAATPPGIDALQGIVDELRKDLTYYRDALAANPSLSAAQTNIHKIEQLIRVLEDEIERMKQEQQQQQQQQQQDKQDDKDSSKDQNNKDKQ